MIRKALVACIGYLLIFYAVASNNYLNPEEEAIKIEIKKSIQATQVFNSTLKSLYSPSDLAIFLAYLSIPVVLLWFTRKFQLGKFRFTKILADEFLTRKKLKESERRFTNIFNKSNFSIALVGDGGVPFLVNQQFCNLLGYTEEEITKMSFVDFTHPEDIEKDVSRYEKLLNREIDSYTIDKRYITKTNSIRYVKLNVTLVEEGLNDVYALALVEDTTHAELTLQKNRQSEKKVREMNRLFSEISYIANIGTWEVDLIKEKCYWSEPVYKIHEVDQNKEIGLEEAINYYHPDHREVIRNAVRDATENKKSWDLEAKIITASGTERWVRAIGRAVYENGSPKKLQGLFQDIDLKKKSEIEIIQSRKNLEDKVNQRTLELKTANEALEAFSYSVSHDLRAPLRAINGYSEALLEDYNKELAEEASQYLVRIAANSRKMGELIDDLLEFSRMNRKRVSFVEVDVFALALRIISELFADAANKISISKLPTIYCDKEMVAQVLTNLLSNAIKYSSKENNPEILISSKEEADSIILSIKDNGVGFNMAYYDKLFQVFQRLHSEAEFEGTGVGLSLCSKIMDAHGGKIWAESEEGVGTTFYLRFTKKKDI